MTPRELQQYGEIWGLSQGPGESTSEFRARMKRHLLCGGRPAGGMVEQRLVFNWARKAFERAQKASRVGSAAGLIVFEAL